MKKKIRSSIIGIRILGLFIIFAIIGIFAGWEEVSVRGLTALLIVAAFEIAVAINSYHTESRMTSFYVVKATINGINAAWISAVVVDIVMLHLFGVYNLFGEYYNSLSGIIYHLFLAIVVFAIGSFIKILAATNSEAHTPESEGRA